MLIKKDNGKVKMELTEEELIIKGIFKDTKIKRGNIRSAILEENRFLLLTYDDKVIFKSITNASSKYREQLKLLIDEVNKENIIFSTSTMENINLLCSWLYIVLIIVSSLSDKIQNEALKSMLFWGTTILYIGAGIYIYNKANRITGFVYNVDKKEFRIIGALGGVKEKFTIENVEFIKEAFRGKMYRSKKTGKKFYLENQISPIKYPVICSSEIKQIENAIINK